MKRLEAIKQRGAGGETGLITARLWADESAMRTINRRLRPLIAYTHFIGVPAMLFPLHSHDTMGARIA